VLPSVGDKTPQISLLRGVVLSQSTFHLVIPVTLIAAVSFSFPVENALISCSFRKNVSRKPKLEKILVDLNLH